MDGQEPTMISNFEPAINIEYKIDNKKSNEQMHQIVKSIETENHFNDLLQAKAAKQQEQQHLRVEVITIKTNIQVQPSAHLQAPQGQQQQPKSSDSCWTISSDKWQEKFKQIVISKIKGHNIEPNVNCMFNNNMLDLEQMEDINGHECRGVIWSSAQPA